jgi:hypothetical protein
MRKRSTAAKVQRRGRRGRGGEAGPEFTPFSPDPVADVIRARGRGVIEQTVVLVTHDPHASAYADRVTGAVLIRGGVS